MKLLKSWEIRARGLCLRRNEEYGMGYVVSEAGEWRLEELSLDEKIPLFVES